MAFLNRIKIIPIILCFLFFATGLRASEPVTIKILTLDNRPPNNLFLKQLGAVAGIDLLISFDPSDASTADLVSLNAAVAGSLVGSRTADPWSLEIPDINPDALLHFAVPRIEPTVLSESEAAEYARIRTELADPNVQRQVLNAVCHPGTQISDLYLSSYIQRMSGWIDFLDRCNLDPDRLLITFDDNRPGPLSDGLKIILGDFSRYIYDGTDEGMMLLLARYLRDSQPDPPSTCPIAWTHPGDLTDVRQFESGMVFENVLLMTRWLGMRISPGLNLVEPWRPVLWIHGSGSSPEERESCIRNTVQSLGNRPVIVADTGELNGSDQVLMDTWSDGATPPGLIGYLGWNTSSNTIGSAFALWACVDFAYYHTSDPEGVRASVETFLWSRILDDYLYQRIIRAERRDIITSEGGNQYALTSEQISREHEVIARRLAELWATTGVELSIPFRIVEPLGSTGFTVELPWGRLFEIELYPDDYRGILPTINPE